MKLDDTTIEVETGASHTGEFHHLKAIKSANTIPQGKEESSRTLAKSPLTGQSLTTAAAPPSRIPDAGGAPVSSSIAVSIVRATTKFEVNVRGCGERSCDRSCAECLASKGLKDALYDVGRMVTTARNVAMRKLYTVDADGLDTYLRTHGAMPKRTEDWIPIAVPGKSRTYRYSYPLMVLSVPRLSTAITAGLARKVDGEWGGDRSDVLIKQIKSPRHYRIGQPIPIPAAVVDLMPEPGGAMRATFALYSTKHEGERSVSLILRPKDARQRKEIADLLAGAAKRPKKRKGEKRAEVPLLPGECRHGELVLLQDRLRPSRWYVRISYTKSVATAVGGVSAAVTSGLRSFLVATLASGEAWVHDGKEIEATLKQFQRRRKDYQNGSKASARVGHGRERTLTPTRILEAKGEQWRDTRLQVIAKRLGDWLLARGVTTVFLEDFSGIRDALPEKLIVASGDETRGKWIWDRVQEWPYYRQQLSIASYLDARGVAVFLAAAGRTTTLCPSCGCDSDANRDLKAWRLKCIKCKFSRYLDVAQAMNTLQKGEVAAASADGAKLKAMNASAEMRATKKEDKKTARKPEAKGPEGEGDSGDGSGSKKKM
jgi:hypothetical protein